MGYGRAAITDSLNAFSNQARPMDSMDLPAPSALCPGIRQAGIDTGQILVVNLDTSCKDALWSMEKALQTKNCGLVLAWQTWLPGKVLRRLQLAGGKRKYPRHSL
ncbi:MAG: hypothetical protein CM1200mP40_13570 [Gammaproteobacteria bacterium]|nr:MAG: hypothetical protein CM1200mP40_13570 [Gammaproteobacteria bacterium]